MGRFLWRRREWRPGTRQYYANAYLCYHVRPIYTAEHFSDKNRLGETNETVMYLLLLLCLFGVRGAIIWGTHLQTTVGQSQSEATDLSVTTEAGGSVTTKADLEGGQPEGDRLPANKTTQPEGGIQPEKTRAILPLPRVEPGAAGSSAIETSQNEDGPGDPVAETNTPGDVMFTASPLLQSTPIPERFPIVEQIPPQQPPPDQTIGVEGGQGIPPVDGPVTQRPLPIETGPLTVTQLPVVIVNQSQIPPPAPAVFPWPIPFPEVSPPTILQLVHGPVVAHLPAFSLPHNSAF